MKLTLPLVGSLSLMLVGCSSTVIGGIGKLGKQELCGAHTSKCQATPYSKYVKFSRNLPGSDGDAKKIIGRSLHTKANRDPSTKCILPRDEDIRLAYEYQATIKDSTTLTSKTKVAIKADLAKILAQQYPGLDEVMDLEASTELDRVAERIAKKSGDLTYQIFEAQNSLWESQGRTDEERLCLESHRIGAQGDHHIIGGVALLTYSATSKSKFSAELDVELKAAVAAKLGNENPGADFDQSWERVKERTLDSVVKQNSYIVSYSWTETY